MIVDPDATAVRNPTESGLIALSEFFKSKIPDLDRLIAEDILDLPLPDIFELRSHMFAPFIGIGECSHFRLLSRPSRVEQS